MDNTEKFLIRQDKNDVLDRNLTWQQIKEKYPHQYVGLININVNEKKEVINADVAYSTFETPYEKLLELALIGEVYMVCPSADEDDRIGVYI